VTNRTGKIYVEVVDVSAAVDIIVVVMMLAVGVTI